MNPSLRRLRGGEVLKDVWCGVGGLAGSWLFYSVDCDDSLSGPAGVPQERDRGVISLLSLASTNRIPNTPIDCPPPPLPAGGGS